MQDYEHEAPLWCNQMECLKYWAQVQNNELTRKHNDYHDAAAYISDEEKEYKERPWKPYVPPKTTPPAWTPPKRKEEGVTVDLDSIRRIPE